MLSKADLVNILAWGRQVESLKTVWTKSDASLYLKVEITKKDLANKEYVERKSNKELLAPYHLT